jgi:hypothetical protein
MRGWDPGYYSYFISRKGTQYRIGQTNDLESDTCAHATIPPLVSVFILHLETGGL